MFGSALPNVWSPTHAAVSWCSGVAPLEPGHRARLGHPNTPLGEGVGAPRCGQHRCCWPSRRAASSGTLDSGASRPRRASKIAEAIQFVLPVYSGPRTCFSRDWQHPGRLTRYGSKNEIQRHDSQHGTGSSLGGVLPLHRQQGSRFAKHLSSELCARSSFLSKHAAARYGPRSRPLAASHAARRAARNAARGRGITAHQCRRTVLAVPAWRRGDWQS
jgi:hypothetical protein